MSWDNNLSLKARHYLTDRASRYLIPRLPWMQSYPTQMEQVKEVLDTPSFFDHGWTWLQSWMKYNLNYNLSYKTYRKHALKHAKARRKQKRIELKKKKENNAYLLRIYNQAFNSGDLPWLVRICKGHETFFRLNKLWVPRDTSDRSFAFYRMLWNKKFKKF